jgi:hypothetical protein
MKTPNHLTKIIAVAAVITAAALLPISASANPGNLYVTDNSYTHNSSIRIYTPDGAISMPSSTIFPTSSQGADEF